MTNSPSDAGHGDTGRDGAGDGAQPDADRIGETPADTATNAESPESHERVTVFVRGLVQGVGFRWWTRARALELGLVGQARNTRDGRVEVVAQGPPARLDALEALLRENPSTTGRPGRVDAVVSRRSSPKDGTSGFVER